MLIGSLCQRPEPIDDGREFIRRVFAEWGVDLKDSGHLETPSMRVKGMWQWLTVEEAQTRFAGSPWLDVHSGCPWVGPTLGYVLVEFMWGSDEDWIDDVLTPLLKEGRGVVASTETGEFHVAVTRQRLPLDDVLGKYGLDDGAQLLDRDWGPYQEAVHAEFTRALAAAGWTGDEPMYWMPTAHNSWRWRGRRAAR